MNSRAFPLISSSISLVTWIIPMEKALGNLFKLTIPKYVLNLFPAHSLNSGYKTPGFRTRE